jgi:hypothetical protein
MSDTPYQPLKGDPDTLATKAAHYMQIADAIQRSVTTLDKINDMQGMSSDAVKALQSSAKSTADDINKAHDRYSHTSTALTTYSTKLRAAQEKANQAIGQINAKQQAANTAKQAVTKAQTTADGATGDDKTTANKTLSTAQDTAKTANAALTSAQGDWHDAVTDKNNAAQDAIRAIVDVVDHHNNGLQNPSWWDKLVDVISKIADICGVLAIFLSWVPVLGEILAIIAIVGSIIQLVDSIVKFANGTGTIWGVLGAAVGVVLSVFGGRIFTFLGKAARIQSLARMPKLVGGVRNEANAMRKAAIGNRLMKAATKDLFKTPSKADMSLTSIMGKFTGSGSSERDAWSALFGGSGDKMKALRTLTGTDQNVLKAVSHDWSKKEFSSLTAVAGFHQLSSWYGKASSIVNLPSNVAGVFGDNNVPKLPGGGEGDLVKAGLGALPGGYISYN